MSGGDYERGRSRGGPVYSQQQGALGKLLQMNDPDAFGDEYIDQRLRATKKVAQSISDTVKDGTLTPFEGGRVVAAAVASIWGHDEFIATAPSSSGISAFPELMNPTGVLSSSR